ncbi:MAG: DUF2764 family protein [Planctomycetota bacterium]
MAYYTLIASLPTLPAHFEVARAPISAPRLRQLLRQLTDEDHETLHQLHHFFAWDRQVIDASDEEIQKRYEALMQNKQSVIREIVNHRINVRTVVAGLRRRRDGLGPPEAAGELVDQISRRWQDPTFGLGRRFPWIERFADRMVQGEAVEADRVLFEFTWQTWSRLAARYNFSFEAIPLYVARWEIIDRWTSRDEDAGLLRFQQLTRNALGDYASLTF